jgi:hypothetical protein
MDEYFRRFQIVLDRGEGPRAQCAPRRAPLRRAPSPAASLRAPLARPRLPPASPSVGFKMVIFIPAEFEQHLKIDKSRVHVVHMTAADLRTYFPYWERLQGIRTSKLMQDQGVATGWHTNSPQARLPEYNPLVMSKFMLLRDAARMNVWGARYHLWMDAGHLCAGDQNPTPAGTSFYRSHMAEGLFVTHWPYGTTTEVHGLTDKAMHLYMAQAEDPLEIVR